MAETAAYTNSKIETSMITLATSAPPSDEEKIQRESPQAQTATIPQTRPTTLSKFTAALHDEEEFQLELQQSQPRSIALSFPEGGLSAWLVVFSGFCLIAATFGLGSCIGLFQSYWQSHQLSTYSSRDIGWISSTQIFLTLFLGVQIGPLFDRYGPRWLTLAGSVGRGLATGVAFMGTSLGGIMFPLALNPILERLSWAWAMRLLSLIVFVFVVFGNIFIKGRLPTGKQGGVISLECFRDLRFAWATVGIACFEFVLYTAIGLLPTYALEQGFGHQASFNAIAVFNAGSGLGRYTAGLVADYYGRFNCMALFVLISIFATFALWLPVGHNVALFYVMVSIFGFGSGSVISLAPVCIGDLCKVSEYGQWYGTSYSAVAFATLISIPIAAELQSAAGTTAYVAFSGGILVLALLSILIARWACLDYKWIWKAKI
ncbi:hypothetical protein V501_06628 [Pseudogymnoascus sp. VKM F-4519 (FW-2642)]|nr:hypothetical protein V501_06628 [Pseudogymnoascus sp. VKM F-4519 (FW-2642)]